MIEHHFPHLALRPHPRLGPEYGVCPESGAIYYLAAESKTYEGDYFLAEYAAQYGRTYVEDEEHLRKLARGRLSMLPQSAANAGVGKQAPPRLLEIGCAAGFFLDEARSIGYECGGLEVSEFAAGYGRERFELDIQTASFLDCELEAEAYDVIAAFYVIEHFAPQRSVFQKIADALKPGGAFLFAIPSTFGPLFEYSPGQWQSTHPTDHHADYSPASLRRIFPEYGLRCERLRPASFHPGRAGGIKGALPAPLYRAWARWQAYGDTLEGVARKAS
ncbi:MAG: class I SAM-dependent methyltransferase [bacterium]|nr:class I SAM-dependent methyltransferase [bacterium]